MEKDSEGEEIPLDYKSLIPWNLKGMAEREEERGKGKRKEGKGLNKDRLSSRGEGG